MLTTVGAYKKYLSSFSEMPGFPWSLVKSLWAGTQDHYFHGWFWCRCPWRHHELVRMSESHVKTEAFRGKRANLQPQSKSGCQCGCLSFHCIPPWCVDENCLCLPSLSLPFFPFSVFYQSTHPLWHEGVYWLTLFVKTCLASLECKLHKGNSFCCFLFLT